MILEGKRGVILGVANKRSIAWSIAEAARREGAQLAFNYQNERLGEKVIPLVKSLGDPLCLPCDLSSDAEIDAFFDKVGEHFGGQLDFLVHSLAYAKTEELQGRFVNTSREGFNLALEISAYTFVAAASRAVPLMQAAGGGAMLTMTYMGAVRAIPNYNVMGVAKAALEAAVRYMAADLGPDNIRVNAISAGPLKTLAAKGIGDFNLLQQLAAERSAFKRVTDPLEVADTSVFLCSEMGRGVTGEVIYVDAGQHAMA